MKSLNQKIREWTELIRISKTIKGLFFQNGWLREKGWLLSAQRHEIIDAQGNPLPWYSYSMIEFLKERLNKELRVFEYGGGYSTQFYAKRTKHVCFVENDSDWWQAVVKKCTDNVTGILKTQESEFLSCIEKHAPYDIIVIDCQFSEWRIKAADYAMENLTDTGVIILDDAEKQFAEKIRNTLCQKGFRTLKFWGGAPGVNYFKCTELFYRENNIFHI